MKTAKLVLLCTLLLVASCSVRVTYPLLELASYWSLGDYMELNSAQKKLARQYLDELFQWHRDQELPRYAEQITALADAIQQPVSPAIVATYSDDIIAGWERVLVVLTPHAATILTDFDDAQVQEMARRLQAKEEEEREEYAAQSLAERQEEHLERMEKSVSRLTGRLSAEQSAMITQWSADMLDLRDYYLAQSELWRQLFIEAMALRHDRERFFARLEVLFAADGNLWPAHYRSAIEHNQQLTYQLLADLLNSLSEPQRDKAVTRLHDLADDLNALAQPGT